MKKHQKNIGGLQIAMRGTKGGRGGKGSVKISQSSSNIICHQKDPLG